MTHETPHADTEARLDEFLDHIGNILRNKRRRASFATYALGLLSDIERKSMEPIAAYITGAPARANADHQRLQYFITESMWDDHAVRLAAARYAINQLVEHEGLTAWIVDDTGFLKKGDHSVGVQRQYTGSAGKTTNCQVGVSLTVASASHQLPIDFALYLPRKWADDPNRRREGKIPDTVGFKTKSELALDMVRQALADGIPEAIVLADADYGRSTAFRTAIRELGLDYGVGVPADIKVWRLDRLERRHGPALTVKALAKKLPSSRYRRVTWREGTNGPLWSRFAQVRVVPYHDDGTSPAVREAVWLLIEWPPDHKEPTKYHLITQPKAVTAQHLVYLVKQRWRTERVYQEMKGELGLDHFEGRSFYGWHHHVSVALCVYAFTVAEQIRSFPPSAHLPKSTQS